MSDMMSISPLMRHTIGFDKFNDLFESLLKDETRKDNYPPYNIEKTNEDKYQITMAVAGFTINDLNINMQNDALIVEGNAQNKDDSDIHYLHKGIAKRSFIRTFRLADHIKVEDAELKDGLLFIKLHRVLPEEKKLRTVPIKGPNSKNGDHKSDKN